MGSITTRLLSCGAAFLLASGLSGLTAAAQAAGDTPEEIEQRALEYFHGKPGRKADHKRAAALFERGASAGRPVSQWMLAGQYAYGDGVPRNDPRALELARAAAEQGIPSAQTLLGWLYLRPDGQGIPRDPEQGKRWLIAAARQEEAHALYMLAMMYARGLSVTQDSAFSRSLLLRGAELGDRDALRDSGIELIYAAEVRDVPRALRYLSRAAKASDYDAAVRLGRLYLGSQFVAPDFPAAARWLELAATEGNVPFAQLWLSVVYAHGLGVDKDAARATQLTEAALAKASASEKNNFAWETSVNSDPRLRDGAIAVRVMQTLTGEDAAQPRYIDTLAAAYAEAGDFRRAVEAQTSAIAALARSREPQTDMAGMKERLDLYRAGKPYHASRQ